MLCKVCLLTLRYIHECRKHFAYKRCNEILVKNTDNKHDMHYYWEPDKITRLISNI